MGHVRDHLCFGHGCAVCGRPELPRVDFTVALDGESINVSAETPLHAVAEVLNRARLECRVEGDRLVFADRSTEIFAPRFDEFIVTRKEKRC